MILTCPECSTRYLADEKLIGHNGRTVRCSKCQTSWFVASDPDTLALYDDTAEEIVEASPPPQPREETLSPPVSTESTVDSQVFKERDAETETDTFNMPPPTVGAHVHMRDMAERRRLRKRLGMISGIWGITAGTVFNCLLIGYMFRQTIVDNNPAMASLYKSFGVEVTLSGLTFTPPITRNLFVDGRPVLIINGRVKNISHKTQPLPLIALSLHDNSNMRLASWHIELDAVQLAENGEIEFVTQYPDPPIDAVNLHYHFADRTGEVMTAPVSLSELPVPGGEGDATELAGEDEGDG